MLRAVDDQTIRRTDGSIDHDYYRAEAQRLRAQAVGNTISKLWFWASDPRARFENSRTTEPGLYLVREC